MRFIIADPALTNNVGHHPNFCRYIADAARDRGLNVEIYGNHRMDEAVRDGLGATPHFLISTYQGTDGDPLCGWLNAYMSAKDATHADLTRLGHGAKIGRDDVVLIHGARAAQMAAAFAWAATFPEDDCPLIVIELGGSPGVTARETSAGKGAVETPDPNANPEPMLCRLAVQWAPALGRRAVHVVTYREETSAVYALILQREVGILPFPVPPLTAPRDRTGKRNLTIAALGHQKVAKGFPLMPDVMAGVLASEPGVTFLLHDSAPSPIQAPAASPMKDAYLRIEDMAATDTRIVFENRAVTFAEWAALVARCDVILCPYDPLRYAAGHSGICSEAVAHAIPVVVPARTSLSRYMEEFGDIGVTFEGWDAPAIIAATRALLRDYDTHAGAAFAAARTWAARQGPGACVEAALALRDKPSPFALNVTPRNTMTAQAITARGDDHLGASEFAAARASYEAALAQAPGYATAHGNLGIVFHKMGDLERAETALRRAHELDPEQTDALANLGAVLSARGKTEEAMGFLHRTVAAAPQNGLLQSGFADSLLQAGRPADAVKTLQAALRDFPDETHLWLKLGDAHTAAEQCQEALAAYQRAAALRPDTPGLQDKLAAARTQAGA